MTKNWLKKNSRWTTKEQFVEQVLFLFKYFMQ